VDGRKRTDCSTTSIYRAQASLLLSFLSNKVVLMSSHITADSSEMHLDDPYQSIRHSLAKKVAPSFRITYAPPTHNTANMGSPNASKGRCTFAHDILTAESVPAQSYPQSPSRLTHIIPPSLLLFHHLPSHTVSTNPTSSPAAPPSQSPSASPRWTFARPCGRHGRP
jgi:hypothetical protein